MKSSSYSCTPGFSYEGNECQQCSSGRTSDGDSGACYCGPGTHKRLFGVFCPTCYRHYYAAKNSDSCTKCQSDEVSGPIQSKCMKPSECDTTKGFVLDSQSCVCPEGKFLSLDGSSCLTGCEKNQVYNSITDEKYTQKYCLCKNGLVPAPGAQNCIEISQCTSENNMKLVNYVCSCLDSSMVIKYDSQTDQTICDSKASCTSSQFYVPDTNQCQNCPENAESADGQAETCSCKQGFVAVNGICTPEVPNCAENQYLQGNTCVPCPENSTSSGGQADSCECVAGFVKVDGSCTPQIPICAQNQYLSVNICIDCPENSMSMGGNVVKCECIPGYVDVDGNCVADVQTCTQNQYLSGSICLNCPENSTSPGGKSTSCTCIAGFVMANGICVQETPNCNENQYLSGNQCHDCPENSMSPGGQISACQCIDGFVNDNGKCVSEVVTCTQNYYLSNNACIPCPPGSTSNGGASTSCTCTDANTMWENDQCVQKMQICAQNYYLSNNTCVACPENATSPGGNSEICICAKGLVMLNGACLVYDGLDTNAGNDKNTNLGYIAIPIVLIIVAAILAAVLIPVLKKKKLNNRLTRTRRTDLV